MDSLFNVIDWKMEAILTKKNRTKLQHNGHSYIFHKPSADGEDRFWACEHHHAKDITCKGRLHTNLNNNVLREVGNHQCEPSAARMEAQRVITGIKRRAEQTMESPATIRSLALQNVATPVLAQLPTKNAIKKVIKRVRHEINASPPIPNTLTDLIIPDAYKMYSRTDEQSEQFLLADSGVYQENGREQRILIFGRESNGRWAHEMKECFADGTFSITPMPFQQVYAILARRNRWVIPVCYCMLSNKTHTTYERMFRMLVAVWPDFNPDSVSMDFETAAITALNVVFPFTEVRGCLFHLVQNFHKKFSEFGLKQRYQNDPTFAEMARCVTSLAFLPIGDLTPGIIALDMALPDELTPVLDWFIMNYTGRLRMMEAEHARDLTQTFGVFTLEHCKAMTGRITIQKPRTDACNAHLPVHIHRFGIPLIFCERIKSYPMMTSRSVQLDKNHRKRQRNIAKQTAEFSRWFKIIYHLTT